MKKIVLFLAVLAVSSFALPIVLEENIHRNANRDSIFTLNFESNSAFWQANNFFVRTKIGGRFHDDDYNSRFILYAGDSIANNYLHLIFSGYYYSHAIHGQTKDWARPNNREEDRHTPSASADLFRALLRFTPNEHILIALGKDYYNWGPAELGGLLLSDYNMGFTGLYQQYQLGPFTIRGLATQLNSTNWVYGDSEMPIHRFFSASRIEYYRERWGMALGQSMVYGGVNRSFEIPYLIPVFPFHYAQIANWRYGNEFSSSKGSVDAYVNFLDKRLQIYGEFMADDLQMGETEESRGIQNSVGFIAGTRFDFPRIVHGFFEAGQINSFVYSRRRENVMTYLYKDAPIGSPLGPDNQIYWGKLGHRLSNIPLNIEAYFWLFRQGERGDINLDYGIEDMFGSRYQNIPYGKVNRETATWLSATYELKHQTFELHGGVSITEIEGVSGTRKVNPFIGFSLNAAIGIGWNAR